MKFRLGACAAVVLLAACSGQKSDSHLSALQISVAHGSSLLAAAGRSSHSSIASAPDRGALMSYKNAGKPTSREGAFTYYPIAMSEDHAIKGVVNGKMKVTTPDGRQLELKYDRHSESLDGNWSWVGHVDGGDPGQSAIITFGENAVFASIPQGNGAAPFEIQTRNGALYAVQVDSSKLRSPNTGHNDIAIPASSSTSDASAIVAAAQAHLANAVAQKAVAENVPANGTNTIDVVVGYTAGFRIYQQNNSSSAATRLVYLFEVANDALSKSNVNGSLRIVNALEVGYTDANSNQTALQELTGSNGSPGSTIAIPAALAPLRTARDTYGADLAILMRGFQQPEQQGCGIAWLIGADGADVTPAADAKWGYGVVSDGSDNDTDGNSYYCAPQSMIHEIGHLLGQAHDEQNATSAGRHPYSYGYKNDAANFYTIMAYGNVGQTGYSYFSSPNLTLCGGNACGTANADNVRSLNQTIPVVAGFRATVVPFAGNAPHDFNGDGRSDVLWRNSSNGQNVIWRAASSSSSVNLDPVTDQNWQAVASGDFNGDGNADVFWRNAATGQNIIWSSAAATKASVAVTIPDLSWKIVGAGDFDGDGKDDLFWRHATTGQNLIWRSAIAANTVNVTAAATNWQVAGIGDFDGDGRSDLFWRNSVTGENIIWPGATTGQAKMQLTISSQAWRVAAVGDFTGDGRADVFWHNSTNGQTIVWPSGSYTGSNYEATVATNWQVVTSGDYNADGRSDLFWFNPSTRASIIWWSGKAANSTTNIVVSAGWAPKL